MSLAHLDSSSAESAILHFGGSTGGGYFCTIASNTVRRKCMASWKEFTFNCLWSETAIPHQPKERINKKIPLGPPFPSSGTSESSGKSSTKGPSPSQHQSSCKRCHHWFHISANWSRSSLTLGMMSSFWWSMIQRVTWSGCPVLLRQTFLIK